jgi:uncharacterized RDD family membrane protein YckC
LSSKKQRWRDAKKGQFSAHEIEDTPPLIQTASIGDRVKAFITDMFMIMMPLAYVTTYLIMDGKDDFQGSSLARWGISIIYGLIVVLFWSIKGQTPGYRAYSIALVDTKTGEKPSLIKSLFRYFAFLLSATTIIGALLPFFRKDKRTLQDILTNTHQKSL